MLSTSWRVRRVRSSPSGLHGTRSAYVQIGNGMPDSAPASAEKRASATFRNRRGSSRTAPCALGRTPCLGRSAAARSRRAKVRKNVRRSWKYSFLSGVSRPLPAGELFVNSTKFAQGAMNAHLYSVHFAVEKSCDVFILEFLKAA